VSADPEPRAPRAREAGATLRVVVADDERPARHFLLALLRGAPDVEVVGEAADGAEAVDVIARTRPDLALLDLQMPALDGLGVVRAVERALGRGHAPLVAFVTAHDEGAVRAFELHAVDYLLKPVDAPRLRRTLQRAHERLERADLRASAGAAVRLAAAELAAGGEEDADDDAPEATPPAPGPAVSPLPLERIPVRHGEDVVLVPVAQLVSVVADGEVLHLTTSAGARHTLPYRLKDLESRLPARQFVRLSRGAIVRVDAIARVSPMPGGTYLVTLAGGAQLPVSRLRARAVRDQLLRL
jgi:two-component system LytT family response regulator